MIRLTSMLLAFCLMLSGCAIRAPRYSKPQAPAVLADGYSVDDYRSDKAKYEAAITAHDLDTARIYRNRIVYNVRWTVDNAFAEYSAGFNNLRASGGFAFDIAQIGLAGAAAYARAPGTKDLLTEAIAGFGAIDNSLKTRYFANVSAETLIGAMQTTRQPWANKIDASLKLSVTDYSFEEARADLGRLYYAGTLQSALQYLAQAAQNGQGPSQSTTGTLPQPAIPAKQ